MNSSSRKCFESWISLIVVLIIMLFNDPDILVETEDGTGKQERLRHIIEQAALYLSCYSHIGRIKIANKS